MSELTFTEKKILEALFEMGGGYVLDFTDTTFAEFILESINIDIYTKKYEFRSGSKANRLRCLWNKESNIIIAKLTEDMLKYVENFYLNSVSNKNELIQRCKEIIENLRENSIIEPIQVEDLELNDKSFELLSKTIKECIDKNIPEEGLDRLHTYTTKYLRHICETKEIIEVKKDKPIHSLLGEYVKFLKNNKFIESEMTETILKTSISVLDKFNKVRNEQSFAHDNPILNYEESTLIFSNILNLIKFINAIEENIKEEVLEETLCVEDEDLVF